MSVTDEIYTQLKDGLWIGLDYDELRLKHEKSKGPFYNALQLVVADASAEITSLSSEMKALKGKTEKEKAKLDTLVDQQDKVSDSIKTGQQEIEALMTEEQAIKARIEAISAELQTNECLLGQADALRKMGFDDERLRQLSAVLIEIGAKHGQKPSDAIAKFFTDLQDYDTKVGFEREIERLAAISETKQLESENWQAKVQKLERQFASRKEAIGTVQVLFKQGVRGKQILSWNKIVSTVGGAENFEKDLRQYKTISAVIDAKNKEHVSCEKKIRELEAKVKALNEQKAEIEAGIKSLSVTGVRNIAELSEQATSELKSLSATSVNQVATVGEQAIAQLTSLLVEIRNETKRLADLKAEAGKLEKELMFARYVVTAEPEVLKSFPKEVVISFLERASVYCELNELNPKVRAPEGFHLRYVGIESFAQVSLRDLIAWTEAGLAGAIR
jgi:chromosome segregation ATPase